MAQLPEIQREVRLSKGKAHEELRRNRQLIEARSH
jgi:hypothetical protein